MPRQEDYHLLADSEPPPTSFSTGPSYSPTHDEEEDVPPVLIRATSADQRWSHIQDLDDFFARIYMYHQRHGFLPILLEEVLQLLQFLFVVTFAAYLAQCVNYEVLFTAAISYGNSSSTHQASLSDTVIPLSVCLAHLDWAVVILLLMALAVLCCLVTKVVYGTFRLMETRRFFLAALHTRDSELPNLAWSEIQLRLIDAQREYRMVVHTVEITELDICHRILRWKNYMVAMIHHDLLPIRIQLPFLGEHIFCTKLLKWNLKCLLFLAPRAPFEQPWQLREAYKQAGSQRDLTDEFARACLLLGILNLLLSPIIFTWQVIYTFFTYTQLIRREPNWFGARRWSLYARYELRHYNELAHCFSLRLNRAYEAATLYVNCVFSPSTVVLARSGMFFSGSVLAVLMALAFLDEDVLHVEHMLQLMTVLGALFTMCRTFLPEENVIYSPEMLLGKVQTALHYLPAGWEGRAHSNTVRGEFSQLFQYKAGYILEELLSPLITWYLIAVRLRGDGHRIVAFLRDFTTEIAGVGDVCSYAHLDLSCVGGPPPPAPREKGETQRLQVGPHAPNKAELSVANFALNHPRWQPLNQTTSVFVATLKSHMANAEKHAFIPQLAAMDISHGLHMQQPVHSDSVWLQAESHLGLSHLAESRLAMSRLGESAVSYRPLSSLSPLCQDDEADRWRGAGVSHMDAMTNSASTQAIAAGVGVQSLNALPPPPLTPRQLVEMTKSSIAARHV